ncbi:translocation/assembly module TamB domain-containing protein [Paracoccus nototheniae]|uniref:Translocation/assembly module TamB domain-containing protein n=1 Tax=Paracoccus nototheniae TaxID=2489002 RepID=A0ABW4DRD5_9RHOB|nr:translocation/assembly module TamB domain-containing protein [Paracoccus nototheniae]
MRTFWITLFAILFPLAVLAQSLTELAAGAEDDRGFLTGLLERNLSGAGRQVVIEGFEGALSSRATFTELRISDDDGAWLTLRNGAIQWNRSALLRRRVEIAELSAETIILPRLPQGEDTGVQAEAPVFALPELPVSLNIEQISVDRVELGQPVIGVEAALRIAGGFSLEGGEGTAQLTIDRLDGPRGQFVLDTGYSNETEVLRLNLGLDEAADGLLVNLVNLYDRPAVTAQISGEGNIRDFAADIRLATNGQPRITGQVSANGQTGEDGSAGTGFRFELGGDVASLLRPQDRAFFGRETQLLAEGWRAETGRIEIPRLDIRTEALRIAGSFSTNDQSAPQRAELQVTLGRDAGATQVPVPLPFAGEEATVETGRLSFQFDAARSDGWRLDGRVGALDVGDVALGEVDLAGRGQVFQSDGALSEIIGALDFAVRDLAFDDPSLAEAVGPQIQGRTGFGFTPGNALDVTNLRIRGADYGADGNFIVSGLGSGITLSVDAGGRYTDLTRLSGLAGRPLTGAADATVQGYYVLLNKSFDIDARVEGRDITLNQPQLDPLLGGASTILLQARRDELGLEIEDFRVNANRLTATAQGLIDRASSTLQARISMPSLEDAGPDFGGSLEAEARLTGPQNQRQVAMTGQAQDLRVGIAALDGALAGETQLTVSAAQARDGFRLEDFTLTNPQLSAEAEGSFAQGALDAVARFAVTDLSSIRADWAGGFQASATLSEKNGARLIEVTGSGQDLSLGQGTTDGALTGTTQLTLRAFEQAGVITISEGRLSNDQMRATVQGTYGEGVTDLTGDVDVASLAPFGPGWRGSLQADGSFREAAEGVRQLELTGTGRDLSFGQAQVDGALAGETRLAVTGTERDGIFTIDTAQIENPRLGASATGQVGVGATDVTADLNASDLRFLGNGIGGAVTATARLTDDGTTRRVETTGSASGLSVGQPRIDPVLAGQTSFDIAASQGADGLSVQRLEVTNPQLQVSADGAPASGINLQARLADLGLIVPEFPGPVAVTGTVREQGANFALDLRATAPGSTELTIAGTAARDGSTTDLAIAGRADSALANTTLRTRSVSGPLLIDLRLQGAPSLQALSGQVRLQDGQLADPGLGLRLEAINVTAAFQGERLQIDGAANVSSGGRVTLNGPVDLTNGAVDIAVVLAEVVLRDPNLYQTSVTGNVRFSGSAASGQLISGQIDLGETEIRIPSTGLGGAQAIPDIRHVGNQRPPVRATRAKAGLEPYPSQASRDAGMSGPPATPGRPPALDLVINAPSRVFIRGRGVDAELGGGFQIQGTARNAIPIGNLQLIRGRVDLLGNRFVLTEGLVELQGSLIPVIRLVAETERDSITTRIIIDGEVRDPDITFESSPELPQEEVLSQLLFGRGLDSISPLQAAQLANAIAVLAGRGGDGIIGNLRESAGLDDLDLTTDDDGNIELRAGRYLSENVYTDLSVGEGGRTSINLNLDITRSLRARGSVGNEGGSSIGVFFERDY